MKNYKTIIFFLGLAFLWSGCANVEKMVDRGDYDQVIRLATRKLAGKKNKKEKYIQAAEEAFAKVTKRDMDRIKALKKRNSVEDWKKIYAITSDMIHRQNRIEPLLPLIGKEGYHAGFNFVKADVIRGEATAVLSSRLYDLGQQALAHGKNNNKQAARDAYAYFSDLQRYKKGYKNSIRLMNEAEQLGITNVLVKLENRTHHFLPMRFEDELLSFYNTGRRSKWKRFVTKSSQVPTIDAVGIVSIDELDITPDLLRETIHHFHKQINETHYARDQYGRVLKDSLGNKIEILVPVDVHAEVFEVSQSKSALVEMTVEIYDEHKKVLLDRKPMRAVGEFTNDACRIRGDRRAVDGKWFNLGEPLPFPSDEELVLTAADELKEEISDLLVNYNF